jgi:uncharacterized protein (DUF1499 family)
MTLNLRLRLYNPKEAYMKYNWMIITILAVLIALILSVTLSSRWYNAEYSRAKGLGLVQGQLTECSKSPNCVSSQTAQVSKLIAPISTDGTPELTWLMLHDVVSGMPQALLITEDDNYRHYQFTTPLMGFVDDVELLFDRSQQLIHVKSASRVGESDIGANRNRVELLREHLHEAMSSR